jgi:hypothetical protein
MMSTIVVYYLGIRGKVWKMAIGNELGLTYELFSQLEQIAREKLEVTKQVRSQDD